VHYCYIVRARDGERASSIKHGRVGLIRPFPLDSVNMTKILGHKTGNIVYWEAVDGADLYQVFRRAESESGWTLIKNTRSLAYKDESAALGVKYYYKVRARNGDLMSSMDITALSAVRPYPLASVKMTKAVGHATGNIIYWEAVENAKLYQVYRRAADESGWTLIKNTGSLAYKDTEAQSGVKYYYKVVARNGDDHSSMEIPAVSATRP
jgi:fibronectin type 3 domain-containing protein